MPKDVKTTQPLLEHPPDVSSQSDQTETTAKVAQAAAPLSQWEILKFIMMTPMSCSRMTAVLLIFVGIVSSLGTGISLAYYAQYTGRLNAALRSRQYDVYDDAVATLVFIIIGIMATQGLSTYCMKRIGLMKRIHLNQRFHSDYFSGNKYYILNAFYSDRCDSVDSRLTSDIETMTSEFFSILQVLIYCLTAFIHGMTFLQDANLALIGVGCMVLLTVIVKVLLKIVSSRVSSRVSDLKRDEGLFSFQHSRVKKNSESIAFYGGQSLELQKIKQMFESVLRSARLVIKGQGLLDFITFFYASAMSSSFPMWIGFVCWLQFATSNSLEDQEFVATRYQLYSSILSQSFGRFVTIAALVGPLSFSFGCGARVLHLKRLLENIGNSSETIPKTETRGELISLPFSFDDAAVVQLSDVSVRVPHSEQKLVSGLCLKVPGNALFMGPSGCGKSSVLRVIAGLWPADGHIKAPAVGRAGLCFLTQRPYMCPLSLRQNVAYPSQDYLSDGELKRLLTMSGLSDLFDRMSNFDEALDWANILSLGEQQRVAFARCFHMMPSVAILDESTSALDPENEELLYQTMRSLKIHFISVGHRSQLKSYHDQLVEFDGLGNFTSSHLQAVPIAQPPTHDASQKPAVSDQESCNSSTKNEIVKTQPVPFGPLFRLCFFRQFSAKNTVTHFLIMLLFVFQTCAVLYTRDIIFSPGIFNFRNTSSNDIIMFLFAVILVLGSSQAIINALIAYVSLRTRKNLNREMHTEYFTGNTYYKFNMGTDGMSDAHSVISSDAERFTTLLSSIWWRPTNLTSLASANLSTDNLKSTAFLGTIIHILVTSYLLGTGLLLGNLGTVWTYIGYFAAALILINIPSHRRLSSVAENHSKFQASFKFVHSRIRMHAETIALYGAEDVERAEVARTFDAVVQTSKELIFWESFYQGLQVLFQYVPFLISVSTGAQYVQNPNVSQRDSVTYIMTAAGLWRAFLNCFYYMGTFSETVGHANRVARFLHKSTMARQDGGADAFVLKSETTGDVALSRRRVANSLKPNFELESAVADFSHVTVKNPANITLVQDLTMKLCRGQGCLISGPSGCGKSSILRVVGRLWPSAAGSIRIPQHVGPDGVFFLPQRKIDPAHASFLLDCALGPYMINASLREEVTYPSSSSAAQLSLGNVIDDRICELLETFGLLHLAELYRLDSPRNWEDLLSLGEQQRVAIIRLILHRPALAILDECTSAISESQQETFYRYLRSLNIAYISVGHRPELFGFHDTVVVPPSCVERCRPEPSFAGAALGGARLSSLLVDFPAV